MLSKKVNPIVQWWVGQNLPYHDIYELPLLIDKTHLLEVKQFFSQWLIHPIKRKIARVYLILLQKFTNIVVIGITGSAGKTTTKEILYSILKLDGKAKCTKGYFDPVYNIPNTILSTPAGTKYLILEMGVEYPGEMDFYLWLAQPDVGIITNIFPTHVEYLKDIEGVFREKSKLVKSIPSGGISVLNSGDPKLKTLKNKLSSKTIWFEPNSNPLLQNANAAKAAALALGVDEENIQTGLKSYNPPEHRLSIVNLKNGTTILDDSYNSNLEAALTSLNYFNSNFKGKKICILGEMRELGKLTEVSHRKLGKEIAKSNFLYVICIGEAMKYLIEEINKRSPTTQTFLLSSQDEIIRKVRPLLHPKTALFVKGARSLRLDKIVSKLQES